MNFCYENTCNFSFIQTYLKNRMFVFSLLLQHRATETQTTFGSPLRNREAERFRCSKQCTQEGLSESQFYIQLVYTPHFET